MRKIILMMSVSLDGFIEGPDTDPSSTGPMVEYARIWRDMPKIAFSRTLERADWNTKVGDRGRPCPLITDGPIR
jgi:hypothetical protein